MQKRFLSILLALMLSLSLLPWDAGAANAADGLTYRIEEGEARVSGCDKEISGALVIPARAEGCPVTGIDSWALANIPGITSVTIPDSVTEIGDAAFYECENLKRVVLSKNVTVIPEDAFMNCYKLESINLPDTVTELGRYAFFGCDVLVLDKLPSSLKVIGDSALERTAMETLQIPAGVTEIGAGAFSFMRKLKSITLPAGVTEVKDYLFGSCDSLAEVNLPDGITRIGKDAFSLCHMLTDLKLPAGVREIGSQAFFNCWIKLTFTGHAPKIADDAFNQASVLAVYPSGDSTWTKSARKDAGAASIVWAESDPKPAADSPRDKTETLKALESDNAQVQNYYGNWSKPIRSYLYAEGEILTRVEPNNSSGVVVERYSQSGKLQWKKTLSMELPVWGGFYAGTDYNFLVFGQGNPKESDSAEVFRVVRYTKNWHRVDDARIYGANTSVPLAAGSLSMTQSGDMLYIHTAHQMYSDSGGVRHQSNISFDVYIPTMEAIKVVGGYVSHSFNQFVLTDGDDVVHLDHGDAYPRALQIARFPNTAGGMRGAALEAEIYPIVGTTGANYTGVEVGGFEASGTHYLTAGLSIEQRENGSDYKNLFVAATDKSKLGENGDTTVRWLTSYKLSRDGSAGVVVSNPQLVQVGADRFLLLWNEMPESLYNRSDVTLHYVFLKGDGRTDGKVYIAEQIHLSDCKPVVAGGSVVWYVTQQSAPTFYRIDLSDPDRVTSAASGVTKTNVGGFEDVWSTDYYADPVAWAVKQGVTSGTSPTTFSPSATCTRAQTVTFLWRNAGSPAPGNSKNPFRDVKRSDYYYDAVLWAVEQGITKGTASDTFSPGNSCTRGQVVTFLWRYEKEPAVVKVGSPFRDVASGQYYSNAVHWAVSRGITNGTDSTHFSPGKDCTRAQIVTFLYRNQTAG